MKNARRVIEATVSSTIKIKRYLPVLLCVAAFVAGTFALQMVSTASTDRKPVSGTLMKSVVAPRAQGTQPISSQAVGFAETRPVSEIAKGLGARKVEDGEDEESEAAENRSVKHPSAAALAEASVPGGVHKDTVLQTTLPTPNMPSPIASFDGLSNSDNAAVLGGRVTPPDTDGYVGPNHYVQQINSLVRVFDKTGNPLTNAFKLSGLFASLGGLCATNDNGDPIVLYDKLADRWMLSQFAFSGSGTTPPFHQCIAISKTPDPTGAYFSYDFITAGNEFPDYPKLGVWPDGYYMMVHQFTFGGPFNGTGVYSFDRVKMLAGNPTASYIYFNRDLTNFPEGYGGLLPSDMDGITPPPVGRPNTFAYFTSLDFPDPADGLRLFDFHADFATPANSTFTERAETTYASPLPVAAFSTITPTGNGGRRAVPQPSPATVTSAVDAITDRLMHRMQYRNQGGYETLVMNHTVGAPGSTTFGTFRAAPRYYELRSTAGGPFMVQEQATFAPADGISRWMASASEDNQGNLAIGYSVSSATTTFPGVNYAGRLAGDPPGGLAQGEATLIAGTGRQTDTTNNRWGDYSGMSMDPTDDCTFWYTQMYYTAASQATSGVGFLTRIGSFKFPTCTAPAKGTAHFTVTNCATSALIPNVSISIDGISYGATIANGTYDGTLAPGSHTYSVTKLGHSTATGNFSITNAQTTNVAVCLNSGTVHFTVTDCATTNPISGATVTIDGIFYGNTAANGSLDGDATPGSHSYVISKLHYANGSGNFSITNGQNTNQPVCLNGVADVSITKTADAPYVAAGSQIGFTVTLTNTGQTAATGLTVTDNLPSGTGVNWSIDVGNTSAGWSVSGSPPSQSLVYSPTTLALGTSTHVHVTSPTSGACASTLSLNNTASFSTGNDGSGMASASVSVLCPPVSAGPVTVTATAATPGPTDYPTVKGAFDAINLGTHQGAVVVWIFGNTAETAAAVLNASGTGSSLYTSILMLPSGGARTVSGAIPAGTPLIDLSGADNVTIDGQNVSGNALTLSNTTAAATGSTSTIRFIGGATNNKITNCTILGSSTAAVATAGGDVLFSTSTVAGGNSNNTISNNNIGPAGANLPSKGVMGLGTAANPNTGNVVDGNNIFDVFLASGSNASVSIQGNNNNWTISNNRIYQTATRTFTGAAGVRCSGVLVASAGNTFTVTGNTIGFGAANGTGTTTITGTGTGLGNEFRGIAFTNSSTATYSSIQGNTISGINQTSNRAVTTTDLSAFCAIQTGSSATDAPANIGNITGNIIGSLDGSSTIVVTDTSTTANVTPVEGILDFNFVDAVNISNNKIGSITINNGGTGTTLGFRGILVGSTTGVSHTITNNTIGGTAAGSITDNVVGSYGMYGIQVSAANGIVTDNTVRNMVGNSTGAGLIVTAGLLASGSTGVNTFARNVIHSLSNASGAASNSIYAMSCSLPATANVVERNLIHSLSMTSSVTTGQLVGIISSNAVSTATYKNNMVRLGLDAAGGSVTTGLFIAGLWDGAGTNNFYFNSSYVGGSGVTSASTTFAFFSQVTTNIHNYVDNIFWNARSNASGTGKNYAISVAGTAPNPAGLTSNFNDLYATGTGSFVGLFNTVDQTTLTDWRTATGQDANSISVDPQFLAPNGTAATGDLHIQSTSPVRFMGTSIVGVTNDFDNDPRPATPAIGADEFIPGSCTFMLDSDHHDFTAGGGSSTVTVTASDPKCAWTAVSNAAFITVDSGTPGLGSGVVGYTVAANTGPARSGTMTIAGMTFTVNQASGCTFMLTPTSQNFGAAGGTNSVGVTAGAGCTWTAMSNNAFIMVTGGSSGSGNGTVNYSVAANVGPARMGTMTIAGITFTVTQDSGCTFTISRDHDSYPGNGGSGSVNVTTPNSACGWTASTAATYIHITSGTPGTGNGTLMYTVDANPGPSIRSDTITIAGQTYTVYQGIDFLDVPTNNLFYTDIGKLAARGVTLGCGSGNYCPNDPVLREQMSAFILRAKGEFSPPTPGSQRFTDVPPANVFYNFIDRLAVLGITVGCNPPSNTMFCPSSAVTREQMSAFILRGLGEFSPPTPGSQRFNDVPPANVFYNFIDRMAVLNITLGCTPDHLFYCPTDPVTRAQMAAFLVRAFDL